MFFYLKIKAWSSDKLEHNLVTTNPTTENTFSEGVDVMWM